MLRLFSSIRKTLINEGKPVKYLKYAVGEFLLIVAGILVALQIQNWNEGRKERIKEREILSRIYDEIGAQVDRISLFYPTRMEERGISIKEVARAFKDGRVEDGDVFLNQVVLASRFGWSTLKHRSATFDEISSSGKLGLIVNVTLRESITQYYYQKSSWTEVLDSRATGFSQLSFELIPQYPVGGIFPTSLGFVKGDLSEEDYNTIVSSVLNSDLEKYIIGLQNQHYQIVASMESDLEEASELQAAIEAELNN